MILLCGDMTLTKTCGFAGKSWYDYDVMQRDLLEFQVHCLGIFA